MSQDHWKEKEQEQQAEADRQTASDMLQALNRIAEAIQAHAEAIVFHGRATAGEFDQDQDAPREGQSLSDRL